jgi:hypothetical protein
MNVLADPLKGTVPLITKESAGYTAGRGIKICFLCLYFLPRGSCELVSGLIAHRGTCNHFNPIDAQKTPNRKLL